MSDPGDVTVTSFRLSQLELGMKEMRNDLKEAVGTLGGGMTALQTQLSSYQTNISDRFVTRRDFELRNADVDDRMKEMASSVDQSATRFWMAVSALGTVGACAAAVLGWFRPGH